MHAVEDGSQPFPQRPPTRTFLALRQGYGGIAFCGEDAGGRCGTPRAHHVARGVRRRESSENLRILRLISSQSTLRPAVMATRGLWRHEHDLKPVYSSIAFLVTARCGVCRSRACQASSRSISQRGPRLSVRPFPRRQLPSSALLRPLLPLPIPMLPRPLRVLTAVPCRSSSWTFCAATAAARTRATCHA